MQDSVQTIQSWSVVGKDRLVGAAYNRPGQADGKTIMTSPVLEVRFMGAGRTPVAFTESGSTYWLGEPSRQFGFDAAEAFVWRMSRSAEQVTLPASLVDPPDSSLETQVLVADRHGVPNHGADADATQVLRLQDFEPSERRGRR